MNKVNEGLNKYCGPAVLSILTGKSVDDCAGLLSTVSGHTEIREVTTKNLLDSLKKLRCTVEKIEFDGSLFSLYYSIYNKPGAYIVMVRRHVVAVEVTEQQEVFFCDNHTKEPIKGAMSARVSQRVEEVYKVEMKPAPMLVSSEIKCIIREYGTSIHIRIDRVEEYVDSEDNQVIYIGSMICRDRDELARVVASLNIE